MVFSEKQRSVLFTAWKQGYLSDSTSYGIVSDVTGLSRKQVSNWTRNQISKLGDKPLPQKTIIPLRSVLDKLTGEKRPLEDIPEPAKRRKGEPRRTHLRFNAKQRKVLFLSWERGFLCDNENYGTLSEITGLTRKQISNWARNKINKFKDRPPAKNSEPISTVYKELTNIMKIPTQPASSRPRETMRAQLEKEVISSGLPFSMQDFQNTSQLNISEDFNRIPSPQMIFAPQAGQLEPKIPTWMTFAGAYEDLCVTGPTESIRHYEITDILLGDLDKKSQLPGSPKINSVLEVAFKGIYEVGDEMVDALEKQTGINYVDIIHYLLQNNWEVLTSTIGIRYKRI